MHQLIKPLQNIVQAGRPAEKLTLVEAALPCEVPPKPSGAEGIIFGVELPKAEGATVQDPEHQKIERVVLGAKSWVNSGFARPLMLQGFYLLILLATVFYVYLTYLKPLETLQPVDLAEQTPDDAETLSLVQERLPSELTPSLNETLAEVIPSDVEIFHEAKERQAEQVINDGFFLVASQNKAPTQLVTAESITLDGSASEKIENSSVKATHNDPLPAINLDLLIAYEAFHSGDDTAAQISYWRVLQQDLHSIDALLGMAAVALRQGRGSDAAGWYGKVLEIEPRNGFAQAAMINLLGQGDLVRSESQIKSMIARQPRAAHLHAALGSLYADKNQWPQAQQAYFEAYRLEASNVEHIFNLAVSLDQLGQTTLALQYYQQAFGLLSGDSVSAIDREVLETRIAQLYQ